MLLNLTPRCVPDDLVLLSITKKLLLASWRPLRCEHLAKACSLNFVHSNTPDWCPLTHAFNWICLVLGDFMYKVHFFKIWSNYWNCVVFSAQKTFSLSLGLTFFFFFFKALSLAALTTTPLCCHCTCSYLRYCPDQTGRTQFLELFLDLLWRLP